ncbi:hypothetical protein [Paenarthrobacter sp. NCHU4564]|uniref:hypothetical protein n=1 Tax=Paenarthrobacter sp. NCHU4564 TaxID=3451353 RepID=UPI003F98F0ED
MTGTVVVVGLLILGAISATDFLWPRLQETATAGAASAMGSVYGAGLGLLSAIASAAAALAAFKAARKSDETAQRATEALGLAMQPELTAYVIKEHVNPGSEGASNKVKLEIKNLSAWPAADVKVYQSAHRFLPIAKIEFLPAATQPNYTIAAKPHIHSEDLTGQAVAAKADFGQLLVIEFSDQRRILRWRQTIKHTDTLSSEVELVK